MGEEFDTTKYEGTYRTKDFYIASLLYTLGFRLDHKEKVEGDKICYFYFSDLEGCAKKVDEYFKNQILIDPKIFVDSMRTIKTMIYN